MIKEAYVNFETAKFLKEKGFDEGCRYYYVNNGNLMFTEEYLHNSEIKYGTYPSCVCTAPTQQMAMKWLREVHGLFIYIGVYRDQEGDSSDYNYWNWCIDSVNTTLTIAENEYIIPYETYEQAAEAGIKYCLENLI